MSYKFNTSKNMLSFILNSYSLLETPKRIGKDNFIGYNHKILGDYPEDLITVSEAKDLFFKDLESIEKYILIKSIKSKIDEDLYNVLVHFTFDYGKNVLKNSKFYLYIKQNNKDKVLEELERYKTYRNSVDTSNIDRRSFDIFLLTTGTYKQKDKRYGNKKRSSKKNVGFRF